MFNKIPSILSKDLYNTKYSLDRGNEGFGKIRLTSTNYEEFVQYSQTSFFKRKQSQDPGFKPFVAERDGMGNLI